MSAPETVVKTKKTRKPIVVMSEEEYEAQQAAATAAAAAAAAPAASTTVRTRKPKTKAPEGPQTDRERMEFFYAKRAKAKAGQRSFFSYTPEGDLQIAGDAKIPDQTIVLRAFTALRPEERQALEDAQQAALESKEEEYTAALARLRDITQQFKQGAAAARDVVTANEALRLINLERLALAYPERFEKVVENPEIRRILLNQPYEQRKMGYDIYVYKRFGLSRADALGHYRSAEEAAGAALGSQGGGGLPLLIDSPESEETGLYHPYNLHEFVVNETRYALPIQAYEGEHFASLGDETMRSQLLKTRSGRTVRSLVAEDTRRPADPVHLWMMVLQAYCDQVPTIKSKLLETGSRNFHVTDPQVPEPVAFAEALEKVRTLFREGANDMETSESARVAESVISKEQQEKDKKGAIIANRRRFH